MARHLCALTTKSAIHAHEPLQWKGGRLVPLWKGSADPSLPQGYRSIFVSDYSAKIFHQCLRTRLVEVWETAIDGLQFGGRAAHGTDMAHHLLQTHLAWSKSRCQPAGVVFVDLKSAFYSVLRQGLLRNVDPESVDSALLHFLATQGLHPDQALATLQRADRDVATAGISDHMERVLRDLLWNTHFCVDHIDAPVRTSRGTRPGDPIGDILFNMVMSLILSEARRSIVENTDAEWLGIRGPCLTFDEEVTVPATAFVDVAFVDDVAIMCHAPTNAQVVDVIQQVSEAVTLAAAARGLDVNFAEGKTEAMLQIAGQGSMAFKQQLADAQSLLRWTSHERDFHLRVVLTYKHLGTWLQSGGVHNKEILSRAAALRASWGPLVRPLYARPQISLKHKLHLFRSLSVSRFLFNVHVWVGVTDREWKRWATALRAPLLSILRHKLRPLARHDFSLEALVGLAGFPLPVDLVHVARLRYLARLIRVWPPVLWAWTCQMQDSPRSWLAMLRDSFRWLLRFYPHPLPLAQDAPFAEWFAFVSMDSSWKGRLRTALHSCEQFRRAQAEDHVWNLQFDATVQQCGGVLPPELKPPLSPLGSAIFVKPRFPPKLALRCMPPRHMDIELPRISMRQMDGDQVVELDAADLEEAHQLRQEGWHATKALQPRRRMMGPTLPPPGSPEAAYMLTCSLARAPPGTPAFQFLAGRRSLQDPVPEHVQPVSVVDSLPPFLMQSAGGPILSGGRMAHQNLAAEYARCHFKHIVIVHFFSGFRRDHDIHAIVDQAAVDTGLCVMVLSVDLCMQRDAVHADLSTLASAQWWLDRVKSGQVIAAGGGPPCETYTAARFEGDGPRPLRSAAFPAGLPALTRREWKQVGIGTTLAHFIMQIAMELAWRDGAAWIEHPQWPLWAARHCPASIWALRAMRLMRQFHCVNVVSFDQCTVGASAVKPTTLLLVRLPSVRSALLARGHGGRCHHGRGAHQALIGRSLCGEFHTARGKIYPPPLNEVLGKAMIDFVKSVDPPVPSTFASHELQLFQALRHTVHEDRHVVQADYHG
eukprot:Skav206440  [mRNA]  locus=scaffold295:130038:133282:- [translate_table: standard]